LEKNEGYLFRNMPGSAWAKEEKTHGLDLSGNHSEGPNQKTQERSNELELHKSQQSDNTSRAHTGPQESEEELEVGQKTLCRQPGVRSRRSSLSRQYERTVYGNQEACRQVL
jgi:hypothetical protein